MTDILRYIHFNRFLIGFFMSTLLLSCSETEVGNDVQPSANAHFLNVSHRNLQYKTPGNETLSFAVYSLNTPWAFNKSVDWLTLNPNDGNGMSDSTLVKISSSENLSCDTIRTAVVKLVSKASDFDVEIPVSITQPKDAPYINFSETNVFLNARAGEYFVNYKANFTPSLSSSSNWLNAKDNGGNIALIFKSNETASGREAKVTESRTSNFFSVFQKPANVTVSTDTVTFDNVAATISVGIDADLSWSASTVHDWISLNPIQGATGVSTIDIAVTPNFTNRSRKGYIYIELSDHQKIEIPVIQRGYYTETSKKDIDFTSYGGTAVLSLLSNDEWSITSNEDTWYKLSAKEGQKSKDITITTFDNPTLSKHSAIITVSSLHCDPLNITVSQNSRSIKTSADSLFYFCKGTESDILKLDVDGKYKIEQVGDWFAITQDGNLLKLRVNTNTSKSWRFGTIRITIIDLNEGTLAKDIPIIQASDGITFTHGEYSTDTNFDLFNNKDIKITILKYSSDTPYDESGIHGIIKGGYHDNGSYDESGLGGINIKSYNENGSYDENK